MQDNRKPAKFKKIDNLFNAREQTMLNKKEENTFYMQENRLSAKCRGEQPYC